MVDKIEEIKNEKEYFSMDVGLLKKGMIVLIGGHPCNITEKLVTKIRRPLQTHKITGIDIFTGITHTYKSKPGNYNVMVPYIFNNEYILKSIDNDGFCILTDIFEEPVDILIKIPENDYLNIKSLKLPVTVIITKCMSNEKITAIFP